MLFSLVKGICHIWRSWIRKFRKHGHNIPGTEIHICNSQNFCAMLEDLLNTEVLMICSARGETWIDVDADVEIGFDTDIDAVVDVDADVFVDDEIETDDDVDIDVDRWK